MYKNKEHKMQTTTGITVNVSGEEIQVFALVITITVPYGKLLLVFTMYW